MGRGAGHRRPHGLARWFTWRNGIVSDAAGSGYEINVALAALALVNVIMGAGRFSLDAVLRNVSRKGRDRS